jgi:hypothetical protein
MNFANNVHKLSGMGVEYILKNSLLRRTLDNVTVVLIAFNNFKHAVFGQGKSQKIKKTETKVSEQHNNKNNQSKENDKKKENIPPQ